MKVCLLPDISVEPRGIPRHLLRLSPKSAMNILNRSGESMHPCLTPLPRLINSVMLPFTSTARVSSLYIAFSIPTNSPAPPSASIFDHNLLLNKNRIKQCS